MAKHRLFCENISPGKTLLGASEAHHAARVLRLRQGATIELFDGRGQVARGRILEVGSTRLVVGVDEVETVAPLPGPALTLATALPRAARQHMLFEKCTELGTARIVPTLFHRSTVKPQVRSVPKWQRIVTEAGKQSGCLHLPAVEPPMTFRDTVTRLEADARLVGAVGSSFAPLAKVVRDCSARGSAVVWIGPEGGLTEEERASLEDSGVQPVSLGKQVLRIETAAIAVAAAFAMADRSLQADRGR